jgi:hypothetical protein
VANFPGRELHREFPNKGGGTSPVWIAAQAQSSALKRSSWLLFRAAKIVLIRLLCNGAIGRSPIVTATSPRHDRIAEDGPTFTVEDAQ